MDGKKTLTKEAVKLALDLLILTNSQATTLEIKLHLQNLEYFAKQEDVHNFMEEIFAENNGKYQRAISSGAGPTYNIYTAITDWETTVAATLASTQNSGPVNDSVAKMDFVSKTGDVNGTEKNEINTSFKNSLDNFIADQNNKTPMHKFHDRIRDSKIVPGVGIVAEYTPGTKTLKTINDLNGGDPEPQTPNSKIPKSAISQQITDLIVDKLGVHEDEVVPNASFINDLGCDSLDAVELVMEMEKLFNIAIDDNDVEKMNTVGDCISHIEKVLGATPAPNANTPSADNRAPLNIFYTPKQFEDYKNGADFDGKNWVCHQRYNDQTEIHVYSHKVTRDQARSRFASLNHIKSGEVRCSMAGNFNLVEA